MPPNREHDPVPDEPEHVRAATGGSGFGIWDWSIDGDRLLWDANARAMLGLSSDEPLAGRDSWLAMVHPDDRREVAEALEASVARLEPFAARFRMLRRDAATVHVWARGSIRRRADGRAAGVSGAFFDVTREVMSHELFQIAVDASPLAKFIVDRNGDIVLANAQAETLFGYEREELVRMSIDALTPAAVQRGHAALRESFFAAPSRRKLGGGRELAGVRKDGREIPLEIALAPVKLADGDGVLVTVVDIAERRDLQAKLSQAERLAVVGELAAGVAHEINNPINSMINCAQLAIDGDDLRENCRIIIEEGDRVAEIVKDLLQFARDDRGRTQPTSCAEVVGRTLRLFGENIKRHGILLEIAVSPELPPVLAQPQQLQQVLLNLLINAKDALLEDRNRRDRHIAIRSEAIADAGGTRVRLSVRDNGPGIRPDLLPRIFEPFVTTKRARGGTGLGLSVSRSIIASFGGSLDVETELGRFTDFAILLPLAE